ncbi:hypothetical protein ACH5RR_008628 [Cinchona calisaya]|uniref:Uncharacterized protein n=1 Tax=Cinchona calisaya TaxID=153742 RepID=A0ABD3ABW7_9GENT
MDSFWRVEVAFSGIEEKGDNIKSESSNLPMKVLPPWMIKQGMNLMKEQRGEVKEEAEIDGSLAPVGSSDEKKSTTETDVKKIQDKYFKVYYAALLKRQHEQEAANRGQELSNSGISNGAADISSELQVGRKFESDDKDLGDDIEWEEAAPAGSTSENFKVNDLNVQADASGDDDDDDGLDWKEG